MIEILSHPIPAVVILLGLLVFVHEFGHFIVGRLSGIAVETFSIGFGPTIIGVKWRGTDYRLSWIPLGGYVKFAGAHPTEDVPAGLPGRAFRDTPLALRAATVLAGPGANFILAALVYAILGSQGIPHPPPFIGEVIAGSRAEAAGIRYGDIVTSINGNAAKTWRDIESKIAASPEQKLAVTINRAGAELTLELTPAKVETTDMMGKPLTIGRAGIALGQQPPIVTVMRGDSDAAVAGLKTGDRIVSLVHGSTTEVVPSFAKLQELLGRLAAVEGLTSIVMNVHPAAVPGEAKVTPESHTITMGLTPTLKAVALGGPDANQQQIGAAVTAALGLADGQLTIGAAKESVKDTLRQGDRILRWNGQPVRDFYALSEILMANKQEIVKITVLRDFNELDLEIALTPVDIQKPEGLVTMHRLPVVFWAQPEDPEPVIEKYDGVVAAFGYGITEMARQTAELWHTLVRLFTGDVPLKAIGGPMLIAKLAGDSASRGWMTFLTSMALISINLGLINLFPIPVLDGGQLVLMAAEGVRRRPLRESAIENFQKIGFAMIMALVVLSTYNDLSRFWKSMLASISGLFQ